MDTKAKPNGFQQITSLSASTALTVPAGSIFCVFMCEAQAVRWRDDGTAPTAAIGILLPVNTPYEYWGDLAAIRFFEAAASAKLNVSYYK